MLHRIVKLTFKKDQVESFKEIWHSSKNKIRSFEGCHSADMLQDVHDPRICFTFSVWTDENALNQYRNSPLFKKVWAETKKRFDDKPQAWSTFRESE